MSQSDNRVFYMRVDKEMREQMTEDERMCMNNLVRNAWVSGISAVPEQILEILHARPHLEGVGVLEYVWHWATREWSLRFQKGRLNAIVRACGFNEHVIRRVVMGEVGRTGRNLTFDQCVELVGRSAKRASGWRQLRIGSLAGERFEHWIVTDEGVYRDKTARQGRLMVRAKCVTCGCERAFVAKRLLDGVVGKVACAKCGGKSYQSRRNASTARDSAIMRRRLSPLDTHLPFERDLALGWYTRRVGTAEFIENYTDVMGNPEARAVWINIHGETL